MKNAPLFVCSVLKDWVKNHSITADITAAPNALSTIGVTITSKNMYALSMRGAIQNDSFRFYGIRVEIKPVELFKKGFTRELKPRINCSVKALANTKSGQTEILPTIWMSTILAIRFSWFFLCFFTTLKELYTHYGVADYCNVKAPVIEKTNHYLFLLSQPRKNRANWRFFLPTHLVKDPLFLEKCAKHNIPNFNNQNFDQQQVSLLIVFHQFKHYNRKVQTVLYFVVNFFSAVTVFPRTRSLTMFFVTRHLKLESSVIVQVFVLVVSFGIVQLFLFLTGWVFLTIFVGGFRFARKE